MTQRTVVVLVAAAVMFAAAVAGQADDALRWRIKQLQAELSRVQAQGAEKAQLAADLESERNQKDAAQNSLASVQKQLRNAQASQVQGQEREAGLRQALAEAQGRLAQVESEVTGQEATRDALKTLQDELAGVRSALAEEQEGHRETRVTLAGVRLALEQASAAVVKLKFAQRNQDKVNADARAELQAALTEAQQRQWQAESDLAALRQTRATDLEDERAQKDAARQGLAAVQQQLRDSQAAMVQMQEREATLQQHLSQAQGRLARVEAELGDSEATGQALALSREALTSARSALAEEQEQHRTARSILAGVRLALDQASGAVVKLRFAHARQKEANEAAQAALRQELVDAQQRHWNAEDTVVTLRQKLSQAQGDVAQVRRALVEEESKSEAASLSLASTREDLARSRRSLEREQDRGVAQGQVLANTQAALSETSASLAGAQALIAERGASHASEVAALQSERQQWVERFWDMEQQRASTRSALGREKLAHQETRQALDQRVRQARMDGIRMAQLSRDATESREALKMGLEPSANARALAGLVQRHFADEIGQGRMSVKVFRRGVKITSADMFDFARAVELGTESVGTLNRLSEILQEAPSHRVRFAVHTDNIPLRQGSKWATNWELSTARAAKLARYLIERGVDGERLSIAGYGEYRPVADNSTPEGRRQNRRVVVIIKEPRNK